MSALLKILGYLGIAEAFVNSVVAAAGSITAGQSVDAPQVRTYIGKQHIAIDVKVTGLP